MDDDVYYDSEVFFEKIYLTYTKVLIRFEQFNIRTKNGNKIEYIDLIQAIKVMLKKHPTCRWQGKSRRTKRSYVLNEAYLWLMFVHFQKDKPVIDADIEFFENRIKEYERVLKVPEDRNWWNKNMTMKQMEQYFERDSRTIRRGIKKMCDTGYEKYKYYENNKVVISSEGIEWLCKNALKHKYSELLENYKMELTELFIRNNYYYDNYF